MISTSVNLRIKACTQYSRNQCYALQTQYVLRRFQKHDPRDVFVCRSYSSFAIPFGDANRGLQSQSRLPELTATSSWSTLQ